MLQYTLTPADYLALNLYLVTDSPSYRRVLSVLRVVTAVVLAFILPVEWLGTDAVTGLDAFLFLLIALASVVLTGLLVWACWPWALRWGTWLTCRLLGWTGLLGPLGEHQLEWNEGGFRETSPRRTSTRSWSQLARVEESSDHLLLFLNPVVAAIVPKQAGPGVATLSAIARDRVNSRRSR